MFLAESSKVVHEALKALFNIVFVYYFESSRFQSNIGYDSSATDYLYGSYELTNWDK